MIPKPLLIQIARILNESDLYKCGFIVIDGVLHSIETTTTDGVHYDVEYEEIDPALYLQDVRGA